MYKLLGFATQNTKKVLYILEETGVDYQFEFVDLFKRENRDHVDILRFNPFKKVPVLVHGDNGLFESATICRYIAANENSPLYPQNILQRAQVDQWLDFFNCHLGRWLQTLYYEIVIKSIANLGDADESACEEAFKFAHKQLAVINTLLGERLYFVGDERSIADFYAYSYLCDADKLQLDLADYPNVVAWVERIGALESVRKTDATLARYKA